VSPHSPLNITGWYLKFYYVPPLPNLVRFSIICMPLFRSTLHQLIVTNPRIRDRTDLEHTIQDFSSAVRQAAFKAIPQLAARYHLLTHPPSRVKLMKLKKILPTAQSKIRIPPVLSPSPTYLPCSHFPTFNYEILNGPPFWVHYTPKQNHFGKSAGILQPLHDLFLPHLIAVCRSSVLPIKPNS